MLASRIRPLLHQKSTPTSTLFLLTPKRQISDANRAALRAARKQRAAQFLQQQNTTVGTSATGIPSPSSSTPQISANTLWYLGFALPTAFLAWGIYDESSPPARLSQSIGLSSFVENMSESFVKPSREKLLPDWSQISNVPQDIPVPHTLVLDLEETLVSSTWDRKYGWRHAKRPGVDKFLTTLSQYYEIVVFTPSAPGLADEVLNALDKHGCIMHRLQRDAMHYKKGVYVKDLSKLNRDVRKIVALDDDPEALQFHPENLIPVKPFNDPKNRDDRTLVDILPLLLEIAREGYDDVPALLRQFHGMDADEMAEEHRRRIEEVREDRRERASEGLGRLVPKSKRPEPEMPAVEENMMVSLPGQLTSKDLVGSAPSTGSEEGAGVIGWLNRRAKDKQEDQMIKMQHWNEVMMKQQEEKRKMMAEQQQ